MYNVKYLLSMSDYLIEAVSKDMGLIWAGKDNALNLNLKEIAKKWGFYIYENGTFPTKNDLINITKTDIPEFENIRSDNKMISPWQHTRSNMSTIYECLSYLRVVILRWLDTC